MGMSWPIKDEYAFGFVFSRSSNPVLGFVLFALFLSICEYLVTDIIKNKIQAKPDKTEHAAESVEKSKVNPVKVKVKNRAEGSPPVRPPHPQNNNGPPPVVIPNGQAPRSIEELCQPSINGRSGPIAPIPIQATDFGLQITQYMKQNEVSDDALHLSLFPYSLTHHATAWYDRLSRNSIHTFDDMMRKFLAKYFPPSMVTKLRNEITEFRQKPNESLFEACEHYKIDTFYNDLTLRHQDTINAAAGGTFTKKRSEEFDYDVDPWVPLILGRPLLRTKRALIDVYGEELTLRVNDKAITFKVGSTSGNPTPSNPIIAFSSPLFIPFEGGHFILEDIETSLRTPDELSKLDDDYYDTEEDNLYLEKLLNEEPSLNLPPMKNEDLKQADCTMTKPSIEEPLELELKDLPSNL
nr:hypothetical protein [Tanacetum cinerariifolium]